MTSLPPVLLSFRRWAWTPTTIDEDGPTTASKFSGTPWLAHDERWPSCGHCGQPMQLFLQLNLADLPPLLHNEYGSGLLQMFYCTNSDPLCEVESEAFFPFATSELLRIVQPSDTSYVVSVPPIKDYFPVKQIVAWSEREDYPNWEEGEELGIELSQQEWDELAEKGFPQPGDKLAGWPHWIGSRISVLPSMWSAHAARISA